MLADMIAAFINLPLQEKICTVIILAAFVIGFAVVFYNIIKIRRELDR